MPIHNWTRAYAGLWHAFHVSWISELQTALNDGRMPSSYYALAEQITRPFEPDILALQDRFESTGFEATDFDSSESMSPGWSAGGSGTATLEEPILRFSNESEIDDYAAKRHRLAIRHTGGDRIVAIIELVSPGNRSSTNAIEPFVQKAVETLLARTHLLIVDLFPPTPRDPFGIHELIWRAFAEDGVRLPEGEPLLLASYRAGHKPKAFLEPTAVGRELIPMPLYLNPHFYIQVPLVETYEKAFRFVPPKWKAVLEVKS